MKLRTLLAAAAVVFVIAAITFAALMPDNIESKNPSTLYGAAGLLTFASLFVLIVGGLIALVRYFAKPS